VHGSQDRNALIVENSDIVQQFELAAQVEILGRLVQEEQARPLRQSKGDLDALTFSSTQLIKNALSQGCDSGQLQGTAMRSWRLKPEKSPR